MHWMTTTEQVLMRPAFWKTLVRNGSLVFWAPLFFMLVVSGGFLMVVGVKTYACLLAMWPLSLVALTIPLLFGYLWGWMADLQQKPRLQHGLSSIKGFWSCLWEGMQWMFFYTGWLVIALVLGISIMALIKLPLWLGVFCPVVTHPLPWVVAALSTRKRSLLGLIQTCVYQHQAIYESLKRAYIESFFFSMVVCSVFLPMLMLVLVLSVVGCLLVPGVLVFVAVAYGHLMAHVVQETHQLNAQRKPSLVKDKVEPLRVKANKNSSEAVFQLAEWLQQLVTTTPKTPRKRVFSIEKAAINPTYEGNHKNSSPPNYWKRMYYK